MAVVLLVLGVVASATAGRGRFVPNEIIVKFRAQPADADNAVSIPSGADRKSRKSQGLGILQGRVRVRQMSPLMPGERPRRPVSQPAESRLSSRHRRLLWRQNRAGGGDFAPSLDRIYRIRVDSEAGVSPEEVLTAYRSRADVEYAEFNPIISICVTPGDPSYSRQWSLGTIHAPEAWDTCRGGSEVVVAIIDTGVDYNHRDLQGNLWVNEAERDGVPGVDDDGNGYVDDIHGYNFAYNNNDPADDHGHGTHVAGIVAAAGDNGLDVAGVCWSARIMAIKILGAEGDGSVADAVPAIYYAVANGADIVSGSWGGQNGSDALREAIAYAHRQGVIVVAAAGNEGNSTRYYPAAYPEVLAVAATDESDLRWYNSNHGDWVDIAAPGRGITSLRMGASESASEDFTGNKSGTSMAAPHVSGACALLLSANPLLTREDVQEILTTTGDPIASGICSSNGRLNVYKALQAAIPPAGTVRLNRERYGREARVGILVADWHLRGVGRQVVLVEAGSGDEELVALTESAISLGVFQGDVLVRQATAESGDGILQVQDGQAIVVRYLDGDDGLGGVDQWRQAIALADYTPPAVLDVQAEVRGLTATITLQTDEPVRAEIRYGKTFGGPYDGVERETQLGESPAVELSGLSPQTTYCFMVALTDEAGNEALADNAGQSYSFVTSSRRQGLRVPADYATIQAAIDDAVDGDTIWVADGTYSGEGNLEIDFRGKAVIVRSENGPDGCTIDCRGEGRAFYFNTGETADSVLDGFTITNGGNTDYGAGIRCMGSSPTIRNCVFLKNAAGLYGGGLCNCYGSHPTVVDCTFRENSCSQSGIYGRGGGMANRQGSNPIVSNCTFIGNSARYNAGALGNFDASSPCVTRCTFRGNRADFNGGAVFNMAGSEPVFKNCIFTGNQAGGSGGAMNNYGAAVALMNCTINGNLAEWSCGGVWSGAAGEVRLDNCILWGNTDSRNSRQIELAQLTVDSGDVQIRYCAVQGWSGTLAGIGNIGLDPLFVDPAGGDYRLRSEGLRWDSGRGQWMFDSVTSPCIDTGNPGYPLGNEPRTAPDDPNSTAIVNNRIDMGAFGGTAEASIAPAGWSLTADADNDSRVDWLDLARMAVSWARSGEGEMDLTRDGVVNGVDLAHLAREWRLETKSAATQNAMPNDK